MKFSNIVSGSFCLWLADYHLSITWQFYKICSFQYSKVVVVDAVLHFSLHLHQPDHTDLHQMGHFSGSREFCQESYASLASAFSR